MAVSLQKSWKWTIKMFVVIHNILPKLSFVLNLLSHSFKMTTICCFMTFLFLFPWVSWHKCWHTIWIYALNLFIEHSGEHWWKQNIFCPFTTPQAFWQSPAPGALSTLLTLVVLYSLTRAKLMSPGKDKTRVCIYVRFLRFLRRLLRMFLNKLKYNWFWIKNVFLNKL